MDWHSPKMSVIVATYNRPRTLLRLLGILNGQVRFHLRDWLDMVVVDDGSNSDMTGQFPSYLFPFKYIYRQRASDNTSRVYSSRNMAAREGAGDVILQLDDDVTFHERSLSEIQNYAAIFFSLAPDLDWCFTPRVSNNIDRDAHMDAERDGFHRGPEGYWRDGKAKWSPIGWSGCDSSMMAMPRRTWEKIGGYDEQFDGSMGAADQELALRVKKAGGILLLSPYFAHKEDEETGSWRDRMIDARKRPESNEDLFWKKHPDAAEWD